MAESSKPPEPPIKELTELDKSVKDWKQMAHFRRIKPTKGGTYSRAILLQYHANFQLSANVMLKFSKTPLFVVGVTFITAATGYYKYWSTKLENAKKAKDVDALNLAQNRIKQLEQQLKLANDSVQSGQVLLAEKDKELQEIKQDWTWIRGWFKKR